MKDHFVNSKGITVHCLAISTDYVQDMIANVERQFVEENGPVEEPVREVSAAGGSVIFEKLADIPEDEWTDDERARATAFLEKRSTLDQMTNEVTLTVLCLEGIKLDTDAYPDTWGVPTQWVKRQQNVIKNPIPIHDEDLLKLQYCRAEVIVTRSNEPTSDLSQASFICTALGYTGLTAEAEEALRNSFLNSMGGANGRPTTSDSDQTEGPDVEQPGTILVIQPEILGGGDSDSVSTHVARDLSAGSTGVERRSDDVGKVEGGDVKVRTGTGKRQTSGN